jgi:hypothetical protein
MLETFVAHRKLAKVGNSFRILGCELGFARWSLQLMKMICFSFHPFLLGGSMMLESEAWKLRVNCSWDFPFVVHRKLAISPSQFWHRRIFLSNLCPDPVVFWDPESCCTLDSRLPNTFGHSDHIFSYEQNKVQLGIIAKAIRAQNSRCHLPQSQSQRATPFPSSIIMHRFPQYYSCQLFIPAVANAIEICQQTPSLPAQHYAPYHAIKLPRNYLILQMPAGKALMITPTWTQFNHTKSRQFSVWLFAPGYGNLCKDDSTFSWL